MSTIILISNSHEGLLFTSDAPDRSFSQITKKITEKIKIAQVPHHGSSKNLAKSFWESIIKIEKCPAVFSVGEVKKDKLPNKEVVEFFENMNYFNTSTNFVYGLKEFHDSSALSISNRPSIEGLLLNPFSIKRPSKPIDIKSTRFSGDKIFDMTL